MPVPQSPHLLHVIQGKAAYLSATLPPEIFEIQGLYTENFSTCACVVSIGKGHVGLFHLDTQSCYSPETFDKVKSTLEGIPNLQSIFVITKKYSPFLSWLPHFSRTNPFKAPVKYWLLPDSIKSITVFATPQAHTDDKLQLHPQIQAYESFLPTENLLRHPKERELMTVQILEQLFGYRDIQTTPPRLKEFLIANNGVWQAVPANNYDLDKKHHLIREELALLGKAKSTSTLMPKLTQLWASVQTKMGTCSPEDSVVHMQRWILAYTNRYDENAVLCCELKELSTYMMTYFSHFTPEDHNFMLRLLQALENQQPEALLRTATELHLRTLPKPDGTRPPCHEEWGDQLQYILQSHTLFAHYRQQEASRLLQAEKARDLYARGSLAYREKRFIDAKPFFLSSLKMQIGSQLNAGTDFWNVAYNVGRCCMQLKDWSEAIRFFTYTGTLATPDTTPQDKQKLTDMLTQCNEALASAEQQRDLTVVAKNTSAY